MFSTRMREKEKIAILTSKFEVELFEAFKKYLASIGEAYKSSVRDVKVTRTTLKVKNSLEYRGLSNVKFYITKSINSSVLFDIESLEQNIYTSVNISIKLGILYVEFIDDDETIKFGMEGIKDLDRFVQSIADIIIDRHENKLKCEHMFEHVEGIEC